MNGTGEVVNRQAAKSIQAHNQTILSSKVLAYVAVDYLIDVYFRDEVKQDYSGGRVEMVSATS